MFQSSVFIELMICAIYGPKCKHGNKIFGRKSLNVPFVKLFLGFLMPFCFGPLTKGKYQQKSKLITSQEQHYFVHFAIRYPVVLECHD